MPRAPEPLTTRVGRTVAKVWEKTYMLIGLGLIGGLAFAGFKYGWVAVGRGFAGFFALVGASVVLYTWRAIRLARESTTWPTAEARIISSIVEVETGTSRSPSGMIETTVAYFPAVEYEYDVQGLTYSSSRILFVNVSRPKEQADAVVARYPAGGKATAYVHSRNPWLAVLEPGLEANRGRYRVAMAVGTVFAVAGAVAWWLVGYFAAR